jgi:hypothetical protein
MRFIEVRLVDRHNLEIVEDAVTGTRSGTGNAGTDERGGSLNSARRTALIGNIDPVVHRERGGTRY